jgi:hypothetical protein
LLIPIMFVAVTLNQYWLDGKSGAMIFSVF